MIYDSIHDSGSRAVDSYTVGGITYEDWGSARIAQLEQEDLERYQCDILKNSSYSYVDENPKYVDDFESKLLQLMDMVRGCINDFKGMPSPFENEYYTSTMNLQPVSSDDFASWNRSYLVTTVENLDDKLLMLNEMPDSEEVPDLQENMGSESAINLNLCVDSSSPDQFTTMESGLKVLSIYCAHMATKWNKILELRPRQSKGMCVEVYYDLFFNWKLQLDEVSYIGGEESYIDDFIYGLEIKLGMRVWGYKWKPRTLYGAFRRAVIEETMMRNDAYMLEEIPHPNSVDIQGVEDVSDEFTNVVLDASGVVSDSFQSDLPVESILQFDETQMDVSEASSCKVFEKMPKGSVVPNWADAQLVNELGQPPLLKMRSLEAAYQLLDETDVTGNVEQMLSDRVGRLLIMEMDCLKVARNLFDELSTQFPAKQRIGSEVIRKWESSMVDFKDAPMEMMFGEMVVFMFDPGIGSLFGEMFQLFQEAQMDEKLKICFGFDTFFNTNVRRFIDGGVFIGNLRKPIEEMIPKLEKKISTGTEVVVWFTEEDTCDIKMQACVVQPKSEMDLQFESTSFNIVWGYLTAIALCVTTFGTISLTSGFFIKLDATINDYLRDVVPLFDGSEIATRITALQYGVKLSPSFLVPSGWTKCLGVVNKYESLLSNKKALFDIPVARTASAYLTSLLITVAAVIAERSFNGGDNALSIWPQSSFNNPYRAFMEMDEQVIEPYTNGFYFNILMLFDPRGDITYASSCVNGMKGSASSLRRIHSTIVSGNKHFIVAFDHFHSINSSRHAIFALIAHSVAHGEYFIEVDLNALFDSELLMKKFSFDPGGCSTSQIGYNHLNDALVKAKGDCAMDIWEQLEIDGLSLWGNHKTVGKSMSVYFCSILDSLHDTYEMQSAGGGHNLEIIIHFWCSTVGMSEHYVVSMMKYVVAILAGFIWDPGQVVIFLYILEGKDVFKRVGKSIIPMNITWVITEVIKEWCVMDLLRCLDSFEIYLAVVVKSMDLCGFQVKICMCCKAESPVAIGKHFDKTSILIEVTKAVSCGDSSLELGGVLVFVFCEKHSMEWYDLFLTFSSPTCSQWLVIRENTTFGHVKKIGVSKWSLQHCWCCYVRDFCMGSRHLSFHHLEDKAVVEGKDMS